MFAQQAITKMHGAKWIGLPEASASENARIYFRKVFTLEELGRMEIYITANNRYKLWVNGHRAGVGPCKGDRWRHYYDVLDISRWLQKGRNVIAVEVVYYSPIGRKAAPLSVVTNCLGPMLAVKGACFDEAGRELLDITTGQTEWLASKDQAVAWEQYKDDYYMAVGDFERVEGRKIPWGWKTEEHVPGKWQRCIPKMDVDGSSWGGFSPLPLMERPIPRMYEKQGSFVREMPIREDDLPAFSFGEQESVTLPAGTRAVVELDAGELTTGYFILKTRAGSGSRIRIRYAEKYTLPTNEGYRLKGKRDDSLNFRLLGCQDTYFPSGGCDLYEPFSFRTFRFVRLEVEVGEEPLCLFKPEYVETGYPLEVLSAIESDTDWVKAFWDVSIRTLQRCMHETYEDCPYYEQLQYSLDTRLEILFTYMASGDTRLALKAIEDLHSSLTPEGIIQSRAPSDEPQIIPVFALYWIFMVEDYYWQTGDIRIIRRLRPTIDAILDWFDRKVGPFGLTENYYFWEFVDWVKEWQDEHGTPSGVPAACRQGPCTTNNLIYAGALKSAAYMVERTGRKDTAEEYRARADAILSRVEELCWCEEKGMYREGPEVEEYSQHAQAWAVLAGLAEGEKAERILRNALEGADVRQCSYVYSYYLFRALEKAGLYRYTEALWDKWKDALDLHLTTWPEDLDRQRSDCHAWGSLPIYEFTRCMLGVQPLEPGWEKIRIQPIGLYLPNAKGRVITNRGPVEVEWHKIGKDLAIKGMVPKGVPLEVVLPSGEVFDFPQGGAFCI